MTMSLCILLSVSQRYSSHNTYCSECRYIYDSTIITIHYSEWKRILRDLLKMDFSPERGHLNCEEKVVGLENTKRHFTREHFLFARSVVESSCILHLSWDDQKVCFFLDGFMYGSAQGVHRVRSKHSQKEAVQDARIKELPVLTRAYLHFILDNEAAWRPLSCLPTGNTLTKL